VTVDVSHRGVVHPRTAEHVNFEFFWGWVGGCSRIPDRSKIVPFVNNNKCETDEMSCHGLNSRAFSLV
jgi:hypothetical protein